MNFIILLKTYDKIIRIIFFIWT